MARGPGWELVGVPYTSARRPGGIAKAIGVLRSHGVAERLAELGVEDAGDLDLEAPSGERGESGLLNEAALERLVSETRRQVGSALGRGRMALLIGGDCPVILGALAAIRDRRSAPGLVMIDGHEDAWPPELSKTGEASDSEVAIALGRVPRLPAELDRLLPLLGPERVLMAGPRDLAEIIDAGVRSIRDEIAFFVDDRGVASDPGAVARQLAHSLAESAIDAFWLHVDLDGLSSDAFAPVDYPQPGGIGWEELDRLTSSLAADPRCAGISVVIYNPDLDPDRTGAEQVIAFAARLAQARRG
jgi:arginase